MRKVVSVEVFYTFYKGKRTGKHTDQQNEKDIDKDRYIDSERDYAYF